MEQILTPGNFMTCAPILAALAAASERLVESIKKIIPSLSAPLTHLATPEDKLKDLQREGWVSALSIACAIATAWLALGTSVLPSLNNDWKNVFSVIFYGILIAGGSRLWNPLVEWLKAIKDAKS